MSVPGVCVSGLSVRGPGVYTETEAVTPEGSYSVATLDWLIFENPNMVFSGSWGRREFGPYRPIVLRALARQYPPSGGLNLWEILLALLALGLAALLALALLRVGRRGGGENSQSPHGPLS